MRNIPSNALRQRALERLIFALDVGADLPETLSWVDRLRDHIGLFKVGKESFTLHGPEIVRQIIHRGGRVFLDLKFHDIPNTVSRAAEGAVKLNVSMFNMHALGGKKMMQETVAAVRRLSETMQIPMPVILAVTVLTSLNDEDLRGLEFRCSADALALTLAKMAQDAGLTGVVASAQDIAAIREGCGRDFLIVTPGIRSAETVRDDDQKRTLTAEAAIRNGADYLVVGRPIRMADDPVLAAEQMIGEISAGLRMRER
ncbi:MAG: orotidine-5'-phosphate decarboxylase [Syntrophus sp. (in: bacteria)]|nr:orotidine-5'-phosphate decarboxylase [Syntrophus sp. (in: bacteria)]